MTVDIRQRFSGALSWIQKYIAFCMLGIVLAFFGTRTAVNIWSAYAAIPDLPSGRLQLVGASRDGGRFVVLDGRKIVDGKSQITVLVTFLKPMHFPEGTVQFEAKRELVDCQKGQIILQGASFYDGEAHQTISRVYDGKAEPAGAVDSEMSFVCDNTDLGQPNVVGYRAALSQAQAYIAKAQAAH